MAFANSDKEVMDAIREKHAARKEKVKEKLAEKKESGEFPRLLVERTSTGLLTVRYEKGGRLPDILQTTFTSHLALKNAVISQYGTDEPIR